MKYYNGRKIGAIYYTGKALAYVYYKAKLVWQSVRSCFGSGTWINQRSWDNKENWNNGKY